MDIFGDIWVQNLDVPRHLKDIWAQKMDITHKRLPPLPTSLHFLPFPFPLPSFFFGFRGPAQVPYLGPGSESGVRAGLLVVGFAVSVRLWVISL